MICPLLSNPREGYMDRLEYWAKRRDEARLALWNWLQVAKLFDKVNQIVEESR